MANIGKVSQIIGPAVDIEFEEGKQPPIYQALHITSKGFNVPVPIDVIVEVLKLNRRRLHRQRLEPGSFRDIFERWDALLHPPVQIETHGGGLPPGFQDRRRQSSPVDCCFCH